MRICFATNNQHKLSEVKLLLPDHFTLLNLHDIGCHEELAETKDTLEGNSLQKAEYIFTNYGMPCFADDSGLEVRALEGAPGVYSARYAGPQRSDDANINLLLQKLENIVDRRACFRTVITLMGTEPRPVLFEGKIDGIIIHEKKGNGGFGYDPVFIPDGYEKTFAEMDLHQKNMISHRGIAVQKLTEYLSHL